MKPVLAACLLLATLPGCQRAEEPGNAASAVPSAAEDAAALFIGTLQGLVMQSLLAGSPEAIREPAPAAFALYRRALEVRP